MIVDGLTVVNDSRGSGGGINVGGHREQCCGVVTRRG